ncbi:MAG: YhfC family intramembrane metalloprotease [Sarcina sp.]
MDFKILAMLFNITICFGIPIGSLIYFIKKKNYVKFYFIGVAVFFVSQILLRLPIMSILAINDEYVAFAAFYPILYVLFLSFTAGLFEEVGRYIGGKTIKKGSIGFKECIAFGLGHGGIEAILIVGIINIQNLLLYLFSKGIIKSELFLGFTKETIVEVFNNTSPFLISLGGTERIFAIIFHIVASIIVLYGVKVGAKKYLFLGIGIHTIFNFIGVTVTSVLGVMLGQAAFLVMTIFLILLTKKMKKNFEKLDRREIYEKIN